MCRSRQPQSLLVTRTGESAHAGGIAHNVRLDGARGKEHAMIRLCWLGVFKSRILEKKSFGNKTEYVERVFLRLYFTHVYTGWLRFVAPRSRIGPVQANLQVGNPKQRTEV